MASRKRQHRRRRRMSKLMTVGMGAGLMYFLDPKLGRSRRVKARDQVMAKLRRVERDRERQRRYQEGVAEGARHQGGPAHRPADDRALADRIRSELGASFPHERVSLDVVNGIAELRGQLDDRAAISALEAQVRAVPGVAGVVNLLHLPGEPAPNKAEAERASAQAERAATGVTTDSP